ncbi:hypothetical protein EK21DRAFT_119324 [Setomelanomma holmii]|uniref:Uncharacterized protein n=1 Tax=Setomelanomma holmii TaxID=210430 RepID=A0A9P4GVP7_9PLEO|nr:hypothetical protein EK21DRAFT_119324 [Setomelanomma holmii]
MDTRPETGWSPLDQNDKLADMQHQLDRMADRQYNIGEALRDAASEQSQGQHDVAQDQQATEQSQSPGCPVSLQAPQTDANVRELTALPQRPSTVAEGSLHESQAKEDKRQQEVRRKEAKKARKRQNADHRFAGLGERSARSSSCQQSSAGQSPTQQSDNKEEPKKTWSGRIKEKLRNVGNKFAEATLPQDNRIGVDGKRPSFNRHRGTNWAWRSRPRNSHSNHDMSKHGEVAVDQGAEDEENSASTGIAQQNGESSRTAQQNDDTQRSSRDGRFATFPRCVRDGLSSIGRGRGAGNSVPPPPQRPPPSNETLSSTAAQPDASPWPHDTIPDNASVD